MVAQKVALYKLQFRLKHFSRICQRQRQSISAVGRCRLLRLRCVTARTEGAVAAPPPLEVTASPIHRNTQNYQSIRDQLLRYLSSPSICLSAELLPTSFRLLSLGAASGIKAAMGGCDWRQNPLSLALPRTSQGTGGPSNPPRAAIPLMHSYQNATKVGVD